MKRYTVITTFNQQGLDKYGQRMISTFEQFWAKHSRFSCVYRKNVHHILQNQM